MLNYCYFSNVHISKYNLLHMFFHSQQCAEGDWLAVCAKGLVENRPCAKLAPFFFLHQSIGGKANLLSMLHGDSKTVKASGAPSGSAIA